MNSVDQNTSRLNMLAEAESMLIGTSQNTKRKILVSLNLIIFVPVTFYFISRLLGPGLPDPARDAVVYPIILAVNFLSAVYGIHHLVTNTKGKGFLDAFLSWSSIIILQIVAVVFVNISTVPTNSYLMINVFPLLAIIFSGLVLNRWAAIGSFGIAIANVWYATSRIGFDFIYHIPAQIGCTGDCATVDVPITLYLILWHLAYIMGVLIIFFESGVIGKLLTIIPPVIDKIRMAAQRQKDLEMENIRMSTELDVAHRLQTMVLPHATELSNIDDLEIAARMDPASEVGGDYYDVVTIGDKLFFGIGDVTGHGLTSGVVMLMAQSAFAMALQQPNPTLTAILSMINKVLYSNIHTRMKEETNMTISVMQYRDNTLNVCGQHESLIVCRQNGTIEIVDTLDLGIYIGLIDSVDHLLNETSVTLGPGDTVLLYTDGATEAENNEGVEYGQKRLTESLSRLHGQHPDSIVSGLMDDIYAWIGNNEIYDDITLLVMKKK